MNQEHQDVETMESSKTSPTSEKETENTEPETTDQIRAEIEATRDEMSHTIDAIQEKLDPQHIKEQIVEKAHDATIGRIQNLAHSAAKQIGPAAEKIGDAGEKVVEVVKPAVHTAQEKGSSLVDLVRRKPYILAGVAAALGATCWAVCRRKD